MHNIHLYYAASLKSKDKHSASLISKDIIFLNRYFWNIVWNLAMNGIRSHYMRSLLNAKINVENEKSRIALWSCWSNRSRKETRKSNITRHLSLGELVDCWEKIWNFTLPLRYSPVQVLLAAPLDSFTRSWFLHRCPLFSNRHRGLVITLSVAQSNVISISIRE